MDRHVETIHALPGRIRLRVSALRNRRDEAAAAAEALARLSGVVEIRVHPFTGSFLVRYDERHVDAGEVARALKEAVGAAKVLPVGEHPPVRSAHGPGSPSAVGRALMQVFRDVNEDLLRRSGGGLDLGVLVTSAFFGLGAAEVIASKRIPAPPWFNLAWWGYQTFMSAENDGGDVSSSDPSPSD